MVAAFLSLFYVLMEQNCSARGSNISLSPSIPLQHKERNGAAMSQFTAHEISSCCLCCWAGCRRDQGGYLISKTVAFVPRKKLLQHFNMGADAQPFIRSGRQSC